MPVPINASLIVLRYMACLKSKSAAVELDEVIHAAALPSAEQKTR
jgi:hypothetical protein